MKKIKAYWLRWWHLTKHAILLKQVHCGYTEGTSTIFCGFEIWFKAKKIGCTCGKVWYDEKF